MKIRCGTWSRRRKKHSDLSTSCTTTRVFGSSARRAINRARRTVPHRCLSRTIDVNLKGTYLCCKYVLPVMIAAGTGSILNVSSVAALRVGKGASDAYTAAKGGILAMSRTLAVEHAVYGVRCNTIIPGPIDTPMAGKMTEERRKA